MKSILVIGHKYNSSRYLIIKLASNRKPRIRKEKMRIAQAKLISRTSWVTIIRKITPPMLEPVAIMPNAMPRFLSNQPATQERNDWKMHATPITLHTPYESMT
ncbi:hypothetical protein EAE96_002783 [Botrytis aclada]|nr:hypothetical protein EAE96_002783 [Botrytis aclada]